MGNTALCSSFMFSKTGGGNTCTFFVKRRGPLAFCIMLHTHMSYIIYGELRIKSILFLGVKCVSVHERSCWASGELCEHFFTRGVDSFFHVNPLSCFPTWANAKKRPPRRRCVPTVTTNSSAILFGNVEGFPHILKRHIRFKEPQAKKKESAKDQ